MSNGKGGEISTGTAIAVIAVVIIIIGFLGWFFFFRKPTPKAIRPINNMMPGPGYPGTMPKAPGK
jgi:hypothetical protein